jgi:ribosomal protein S18 acetylase RimI-like enzyme
MTIHVERATEDDLDRIVEIAERLQLNEQATQDTGFLVSDFGRSHYRAFVKYSQERPDQIKFLVAKDSTLKIIGFLLAYDENYVTRLPEGESPWRENSTEKTILRVLAPVKFLLVTPQTNFYLIKQVAVHPDHSRKGVGQVLYFEFLSNIEADYVFSAIVADPHNAASENFHRSLGFAPIMQCYSFSKKREVERGGPYINNVWLRPALPSIYRHKTETELEALPFSDVIFRNLDHAARLYRHEDNLNWIKLRSMIVSVVGLTTVAWLVINDKIGGAHRIQYSGLLSTMLGILGFAIIVLYAWSLQSGLFFMHSHKQIIRILEAKIRLSRADYISPLLRVPSMSKSFTILSMAHYFAIGMWTLVCFVLGYVRYHYGD